MKEKIIFARMIKILAVTIILSSSFLGCKDIKLEDSSKVGGPSVKASKKGIMLSIPQNTTGTKTIAVYRYDVTEEDNPETYLKLAVLFPKNYAPNTSMKGNSFLYEDLYVLQNHSYRYCVKYFETSVAVLSNLSDKIKAPEGCDYDDAADFLYATELSQFIYMKETEKFKLSSTISIPSGSPLEAFTPMLAVSNGTDISLFELPELNSSGEIFLTNLFTENFLNTPIKILGIVGQKPDYLPTEEETETQRIQSYTWTPLCSIGLCSDFEEIIDDDGNVLDNTITVETQTGTEAYNYPDL